MSNIEEDIKILEKDLFYYNEIKENFDKGTVKFYEALKHILTERKQDKSRIQELEEALLKVKDKNATLFITCRNSIPKQKVKEGLEDIEDYFDRLNGPDEDIEYIRNIKKELLEESK